MPTRFQRDDARPQRERHDRKAKKKHGSSSRVLSRHDVVVVLNRRGYHKLSRVVRRGAVYEARAVSGRGIAVAVVVGARNGRILNVERVSPAGVVLFALRRALCLMSHGLETGGSCCGRAAASL
ncbi:hypothetical protein [Breoghania sp.]|uniref:hypothetical protein n=1 Tax=Breoghania sp. TaxID=2065378 RepID=UPI002614ABB1|nr:hypothetical protein [Breoghania sp.]MDJ0932459.1 hypothetical protein [Breoghania sp.]